MNCFFFIFFISDTVQFKIFHLILIVSFFIFLKLTPIFPFTSGVLLHGEKL